MPLQQKCLAKSNFNLKNEERLTKRLIQLKIHGKVDDRIFIIEYVSACVSRHVKYSYFMVVYYLSLQQTYAGQFTRSIHRNKPCILALGAQSGRM